LPPSTHWRWIAFTSSYTIIAVEGFRRPWSMQPFAVRGVGELWLASLTKPAFRQLMHMQGIGNRGAVTNAELDAYVELLKREDGGRAFLKVMRGFERTAGKQELYERAVRGVPYPVQIVWGAEDPALKLGVQGEQARRITGLETLHTLPAKHFLQEDQAPPLAELIARHAGSSSIG
jgi:pimeloyl-ACP methyl ester carboxylesterase